MVRHDLRHPEGRLEPVQDRVAVTHHPAPAWTIAQGRSPSAHAPSERLLRSRSRPRSPARSQRASELGDDPDDAEEDTCPPSVGTWWWPTREEPAGERVPARPGPLGQADGRRSAARGVDGCRGGLVMRLAGFSPAPYVVRASSALAPGSGWAVFTTLTIAPCMPSTHRARKSTLTSSKPAPRAPRRLASESAPAMHPTWLPRLACSSGESWSSATTSADADSLRFRTRAISVSTAALSVERLMTQLEMIDVDRSVRERDRLSITPSGTPRSCSRPRARSPR